MTLVIIAALSLAVSIVALLTAIAAEKETERATKIATTLAREIGWYHHTKDGLVRGPGNVLETLEVHASTHRALREEMYAGFQALGIYFADEPARAARRVAKSMGTVGQPEPTKRRR